MKRRQSGFKKKKKKRNQKREEEKSFFGSRAPVGLLDALDDGLDVERADAAKVDDLDFDALLLLEDLGSSHRVVQAKGVRDDGDVLAVPLDLGLADRKHKVVRQCLGADRECLAVEDLVLEENDRVRVTDRRLCTKRGARAYKTLGHKPEKGIRASASVASLTLSRPLQSSALHGLTTFKPGIWPYQAE